MVIILQHVGYSKFEKMRSIYWQKIAQILPILVVSLWSRGVPVPECHTVVSSCSLFIGKSFPCISCLSLHGLHEESTKFFSRQKVMEVKVLVWWKDIHRKWSTFFLLTSTDTTEARLFAQESSSTHRIGVHFYRNCPAELYTSNSISVDAAEPEFCGSNLIPMQKSEHLWLP